MLKQTAEREQKLEGRREGPGAAGGADAHAEDLGKVRRVLEGEPGAFEELFREYSRRIYLYAARRLNDNAEAEDLVQDVFFDVYNGLESYQGRSSLSSWIFGIAFNHACRRFRRRPPEPGPESDVSEERVAVGPTVEEVVDAARAVEGCGRLLEKHRSQAHRQIFHLHYRDNRSVRAIAETTGRNPSTVRVSLFRSRQLLREGSPNLEAVLRG